MMSTPLELSNRSFLVGLAWSLLREKGRDADRVAAEFAISTQAETEVPIPLAVERAFLEAVAVELGDPFLGVHLAARCPRGAYQLVEYVVRNAKNVRGGAAHIARYGKLLGQAFEVTFTEIARGGIIEWRCLADPLGAGRHAHEFFITFLILQARHLTGAAFVPERVWFPHRAPDDVSELVATLGTPALRFGATSSGFELDHELLALPIQSHDPTLLKLLERAAEQALESRPRVARFSDVVRLALRKHMGRAMPLESLARELRLGERTVQRRLRDEGLTFTALYDSERAKLARTYAADPHVTFSEIAFRLGFAEESSFFRAFRRWTGTTPNAFRCLSGDVSGQRFVA